MKTIRLSATEARNNFFQILNQVMYEGVRVIINKVGTNKQVVLQSTMEEDKKKAHEDRTKTLKETFGVFKDVPLSHFTDDRFRGKRAKEYLDRARKWDV
jgi:prevent-host-death family protein